MNNSEIAAEAAKKLEDIQNKYDIFFKVTNRTILDYFEVNFNPSATLRLKDNSKLPFTIINDLKKEFDFVDGAAG